MTRNDNNQTMKYKADFKVRGMDDVMEFIRFVTERIGAGFHPDDPFESYGVFDKDEAEICNGIIDQCFEVCDQHYCDIYEIAYEYLN